MANFMLSGLNIYVKDAPSKKLAVLMCLINSMGVTESNLIEIERIPEGSTKVVEFSQDDINKLRKNIWYRRKQHDSFID